MSRLLYHGFTLVEMLVVIVIIGIILSFAMLGIGYSKTPLEQETQRLASLIKLARFEALLQTQVIGLFFDPESYHFYQFQEQHWQRLEENDVFRSRFLQEGIHLSLRVENMTVPLEKCKTDLCSPQVWFLPDGEFTPFEIIFYTDQSSYRLLGRGIGEMTIEHDETP